MGISDYLAGLREHIGTALILHPGVSALIRDEAGRLLLERRADSGDWSLPGGAVDPGEAPAQALVREVREETGLVVRPWRLVALIGPQLIVYPHGDRLEVTTSVFNCEVVGGRLAALDGESLELRYVAQADLPDSPFLAPYPLAELLSAGEGAWFAWDEAWLPVT
ncbi:MAG: NUDIX domain-containing protein [Actinomycetota bacterium]|nr:NUDIX domain-containing protein [Actinomycetota bacterium]